MVKMKQEFFWGAASVGFPLGLLLLDPIIYPGFTEKYLGIPVLALLIGLMVLHLPLRIWWSHNFTATIHRALFATATVLLSLMVGLRFGDYLLYENFSFGTFHIHGSSLDAAVLFAVTLSLLYLSKHRIRQLHPWATFLVPFFLFFTQFYIWDHYPHSIFAPLKREDGVYEYGTFGAYVAASVLMAVSGKQLWRRSTHVFSRVFAGCFLVGSLVFFGIAGEEISWGQRLLGIPTPERIASHNTQQEITVHNLYLVIGFVYYSYLALAFYCATAWLVVRLLQARMSGSLPAWLHFFVPRWYWLGFFLPMIIYVPLRETYGYSVFGHWEELSEFFLSLGILGHVVEIARRVQKGELPFSHGQAQN